MYNFLWSRLQGVMDSRFDGNGKAYEMIGMLYDEGSQKLT